MSDGSTVPSPQRGKPLKSSREEAVTTGTSRIPVKQRPTQPPLHVRHTKVADGAQVNFRRGRSSSINPISSFGTPKSLTANQVTPQKRSVSTDPQLPLPVSLPSSSSSSSSSPSQPASSTRSYAPSPPPPGRQNQQQQPTPTSAGVISRFPSSSASLPASHIPRVSQTNVYKRAQSVAVTSYATAEAARLRLIERATKARLYLLHQIGPNRFLIGGDSLDSRFYVTIGSQNCTCSKPHCIHLLFVMMRVLKVGPGDPLLFAKQLRNYETEGLLNALHLRNSQRTTPRKVNRRRFEFAMGSKPGSGGSGSSARPHSIVLCTTVSDDVEEEAEKTGGSQTTTESDPNVRDKVREEGDGDEGEKEEEVVVMEEEGEKEEEESDKSEDEDVCPICLNELDEGEDLITCRRCGNRLHQHCMDIWAGEQIRKKEVVQCPVCRTPWELTTPSPSKPSTQSFLQVSIPVGSAGGASQGVGPGGLRLKSLSPSQQVNLSREKIVMLEKIRKVFGEMVMEGVLSSDWKSREMAVTHTSREVIPLLLPLINSGTSSTLSMSEWRDVHEASLLVVLNGCSDSVLKVFLASLELLRVVLGYTVCTTEDDSSFLQSLIKPLILTLLTRCADAQSRVKECSIDTVCHFCLGQEGPLSLGSACGKTSPFCITSLPFVVRCALKFEEKNGDAQTWHWWLGRLNFIERMIQRFSWDFLLENCTDRPPFSSDYDFEEDSISSLSLRSIGEVTPLEDEEDEEGASREEKDQVEGEKTIKNRVPEGAKGGGGGGKVDYHLHPPPVFPARRSLSSSPHSSPPVHPASHNNLLAQAWYFAARATHVPHHKVGKVARRVIIRIAKVLRNEPSSLEIVHDVVSRCHRTAAEGLLDRVLNAREKPNSSSSQPDEEPPRRKRTEERKETTAGGAVGKYSPFSETPRRKQSPLLQKRRMATPERSGGVSPRGGALGERRLSEYGSDDSYRSAVSDLSGDDRGRGEEEEEERRPEGASSSGASSDSKSGDRGGATGSSSDSSIIKLPKYYQRQTTVDSAFSSGSVSTEPEGSGIEVFQCKRNIEEEEAAAEAKVRSLQPEDTPHPSLYGIAPPNPETLIHVQTSRGAEATDSAAAAGGGGEYMEGRHWVKGKLIGTGAFCSCFLARDTRIGTMMAVKQVSYARNTKTEEETELKRLQDEALMLGRLSHPNIVRCLGATQHEGHINIFIEWMAGGCLDQVLHDFGRFEESVIRNYTKQIVFGIVYLHEHGIIHRDLKGGNVLLDSTGQRIRIADFGAAARLASHTTGLGEFQDMEGTVAFMAPEVVRGGTTEEGSATGYGRKCDVWSIGCVIIQMAAAKPPWAGTYDVKNKFQLVFKIGQATEPPPIPHISDPALKDLTLRCLEVNPDDRPISSELLKHPLFTSS